MFQTLSPYFYSSWILGGNSLEPIWQQLGVKISEKMSIGQNRQYSDRTQQNPALATTAVNVALWQ